MFYELNNEQAVMHYSRYRLATIHALEMTDKQIDKPPKIMQWNRLCIFIVWKTRQQFLVIPVLTVFIADDAVTACSMLQHIACVQLFIGELFIHLWGVNTMKQT